MLLDYVALVLLIVVVVVVFYGIIALHDIPYMIAEKRHHPHQDAIHVAGWISLFTLHVIWPFLWIWATLYREDRGWGMGGPPPGNSSANERIAALEARIAELEKPGGH